MSSVSCFFFFFTSSFSFSSGNSSGVPITDFEIFLCDSQQKGVTSGAVGKKKEKKSKKKKSRNIFSVFHGSTHSSSSSLSSALSPSSAPLDGVTSLALSQKTQQTVLTRVTNTESLGLSPDVYDNHRHGMSQNISMTSDGAVGFLVFVDKSSSSSSFSSSSCSSDGTSSKSSDSYRIPIKMEDPDFVFLAHPKATLPSPSASQSSAVTLQHPSSIHDPMLSSSSSTPTKGRTSYPSSSFPSSTSSSFSSFSDTSSPQPQSVASSQIRHSDPNSQMEGIHEAPPSVTLSFGLPSSSSVSNKSSIPASHDRAPIKKEDPVFQFPPLHSLSHSHSFDSSTVTLGSHGHISIGPSRPKDSPEIFVKQNAVDRKGVHSSNRSLTGSPVGDQEEGVMKTSKEIHADIEGYRTAGAHGFLSYFEDHPPVSSSNVPAHVTHERKSRLLSHFQPASSHE